MFSIFPFSSSSVSYFESDPPRLIEGLSNMVRNQSDSVTFKCSFLGVPAPAIEWYLQDIKDISSGMQSKDKTENVDSGTLIESNMGGSIVNSTKHRVDNFDESQSTLIISSLIRSRDEGTYSCRGRNNVNSKVIAITFSSANLTVYGKQSLKYCVPYILLKDIDDQVCY